MPGDWIPAATDLAKKGKVLAFARAAGINRHEATGLLIDFWGYVSEQSVEGVLTGVALSDLPSLIGGTPAFWNSVASARWVFEEEAGLRIPENADHPWVMRGVKARLLGRRRQSEFRARVSDEGASEARRNAQRNTNRNAHGPPSVTHSVTHTPHYDTDNQTTTDLNRQSDSAATADLSFRDTCQAFAEKLYADTGSTNADDPFLWQVAVLADHGVIADNWLLEALESVSLEPRKNPVGYFRRCLERHVGGNAALKKLIRRVRLSKTFPRCPPHSSFKQVPRPARKHVNDIE